MESFMDKLAQKFNAQDMIKANSQAEAAEMERLKKQMEQYENCLNEMQELNRRNVEAMGRISDMVDSMDESGRMLDNRIVSMSQLEDPSQKINELVETGLTKFNELEVNSRSTEELEGKMVEQFRANIEAMKTILEGQQAMLDGKLKKMEEYVHRESVKVYRNVQAVVNEETEKQVSQVASEISRHTSKMKSINTVGIITLIIVILGLFLQVAMHLNVF